MLFFPAAAPAKMRPETRQTGDCTLRHRDFCGRIGDRPLPWGARYIFPPGAAN